MDEDEGGAMRWLMQERVLCFCIEAASKKERAGSACPERNVPTQNSVEREAAGEPNILTILSLSVSFVTFYFRQNWVQSMKAVLALCRALV